MKNNFERAAGITAAISASLIAVDGAVAGNGAGVFSKATLAQLDGDATLSALKALNATTLAGGTTAYTSAYAISSYTDGLFLIATVNATSTGSITLNVNGKGAKKVYKSATEQAGANDFVINAKVPLAYNALLDGAAGGFQIVGSSVSFASAAEINTGTEASKAVSPDSLAGSNLGTARAPISIVFAASDCAAGDDQAQWGPVPSSMAGMKLVSGTFGHNTVGAGGTASLIDVRKETPGGSTVDMLTTAFTIASGARNSSTQTIKSDGSETLAAGDWLHFDLTAVDTGTAPKGLCGVLEFRLP